ncbi:MAG: helix-turn-helix domain-containing protein [Aminobacteriaceae bacterium]
MRKNEVRYYLAEEQGLEVVSLKGSQFFYPEHNHVSTYTVSVVVSGALRLETENATIVHRAGSFFVIPPYQPHALSSCSDGEMLTFCVGGDLLRSLSGGAQFLADCLRALPGAFPSYPGFFPAGFRRMLDRLLSSHSETVHREREFVGAMRQRLLLYPEEPLDLGTFAEALHVSKFHLLREFKRSVGLPPHKFQTQNRIRKARKMMLDMRLPLTEVALAAGFYDQSHFIRCFKKYTGMAPSEFREACVVGTTSAERGEKLGEKREPLLPGANFVRNPYRKE